MGIIKLTRNGREIIFDASRLLFVRGNKDNAGSTIYTTITVSEDDGSTVPYKFQVDETSEDISKQLST